MSKMTLRKKVSLIVVSTLSASILSVVSAPVSSALTVSAQGGGTIILATTADADGTATNNLTSNTLAADQTFTSVGWVADTRASSVTSTGGVAVLQGATGTGQMTQPGSIAFRAAPSAFP